MSTGHVADADGMEHGGEHQDQVGAFEQTSS
jgi:hypothetical protein